MILESSLESLSSENKVDLWHLTLRIASPIVAMFETNFSFEINGFSLLVSSP
uniref:Uncharacterized protein n=1 Tax=Solanum tuberosum TaxID=4113 RepID=M1DC97_SOLTU